MNKDELSESTGIRPRKIQYMVDMGILEPADKLRGRAIEYGLREQIEALMAVELQDQHMSVFTITGIFDHLRKENRKGELLDFFAGDDWGRTRDVVHLTAIQESGSTHRYTGEVGQDYRIPDEAMEHVVLNAAGPITMIPLGKVKIAAMKRSKQ